MTKPVPVHARRDSQPILLPGLRLMRTLALLVFGALLLAGPARADIPASLKSSCTSKTPATGLLVQVLRRRRAAGRRARRRTSAASTPSACRPYDVRGGGYEGLPPKAPDAATMPGADTDGRHRARRRHLGPDAPAAAGRLSADRVHARLLLGQQDELGGDELRRRRRAAGTTTTPGSPRAATSSSTTRRAGSSTASNGNQGSTGETQLDSRRYEINDFQYLAGLVADDPFFNVNPQKVVVDRRLLRRRLLVDGAHRPDLEEPRRQGHEARRGRRRSTAGPTSSTRWSRPAATRRARATCRRSTARTRRARSGSRSSSIIAALYDSGKTGIPPGSATRPSRPTIDEAFGVPAVDRPVRDQPALHEHDQQHAARRSSTTAPPTTRTTCSRRSRPTRATGSRSSTPARSPTRCSRRSRTCGCTTASRASCPSYPIQQYFGDYQHFVQNKAKEWGDICGADHHVCTFADYPGGDVNATPTGLVRTGATTRLNRFIDHYAQPPGQPERAAAGVRRHGRRCRSARRTRGAQPGRRAGRHLHGAPASRRSRRTRCSST